jgi:glycosyltransferase involved in cell wall biosynthesis
MRVIHVIPFLWSGAGKVLTDLCISQSTRHDVTIVTSGTSKGMSNWPFYRRRLTDNGVAHRCIDFFDRDPAVYWKSVNQLAACISEIRPDVVHCHSGVPACAAATVRDANPGSFRLISQLHSWGDGRPEWMNTMDLWGFNRSDLIIANAASYRRILAAAGVDKNRIVSVPWGVAPEALESAPATRRGSGRIGFVGRIEPRKCQLDLVQAFDLLRRKRPNLRLELLGPAADLAYAREIEKVIRAHHLSDSVWLGGQVRNVYRHERNWDLFVSLSSDEGQGMAILEAMALGVPVVARNCPGVQDYLRDGKNAIALKSDSVKTVAQTMQWALDHPETTSKLSVEAREMVKSMYAWERTVLGMETVYGIWEDSGLASNG